MRNVKKVKSKALLVENRNRVKKHITLRSKRLVFRRMATPMRQSPSSVQSGIGVSLIRVQNVTNSTVIKSI